MGLVRMGNSADKQYASAVIASGRFIFVSGQTPILDGQPLDESIGAQTNTVLEKLSEILDSAGATLDDVVRCGVFVADLADLPGLNSAYVHAFGQRLPARSTVGVDLPGYKVEIDCIALIPERSTPPN